MSLAIDATKISAVLLADGQWYEARGFDLDSYEIHDGEEDDNRFWLLRGGQSGICATGFRFTTSDNQSVAGPGERRDVTPEHQPKRCASAGERQPESRGAVYRRRAKRASEERDRGQLPDASFCRFAVLGIAAGRSPGPVPKRNPNIARPSERRERLPERR